MIGIQPTGNTFSGTANGHVTLRVQNDGNLANQVSVSYDVYINNDGSRGSDLLFSYSTDGTNFTPVPSATYTAPEASDTDGLVFVQTTVALDTASISVQPNEFFYIRWTGANNLGSGTRDEYGIDNVSVTLSASAGPVDSSFVLINEILFDTAGTDTPNEYIELRGQAGTVVPANTYLVNIEGDSDSGFGPGKISQIFNLSGLAFGSNGYLVLAQNGNGYSFDSNANVLTSSTSDFGGLTFFQSDNDLKQLENATTTFMLISSATAPNLTDDVDDKDGGELGGPASSWTILDSVAVSDGDPDDLTYSPVVFTYFDSVSPPLGYVSRAGNSTGQALTDWVGAELVGTAPDFTLAIGATSPAAYAGLALNHIGSSNPLVTPVPTVDLNRAITMNPGQRITLSNALLSASDPDTTAANLVYTVVTGPAQGTLTKNGVAITSFTQADLDVSDNVAGAIRYTTTGLAGSTDSITLSLSDGNNVIDPIVLDISIVAPGDPVDYAGGDYTQNFDNLLPTPIPNDSSTLPTAMVLPQGWVIAETSGTNDNANSSIRIYTSADTSGDTMLLGAVGSNERALGSFSSGSLTSRYGVALVNTTSQTFASFTLSYTGEQWRDGRSGAAVTNTLTFDYSVGAPSLTSGIYTSAPSLDFVAPVGGSNPQTGSDAPLDGNAAENQSSVTGTISGLGWGPGETLWLRWTDINDAGNDDILGIDNLTFSASSPVGNTDPTVVNSAATLLLGITSTISPQMLQVTDAEQNAGSLVYTVGAASTGVLNLDGSPIGAGSTFTQADVNNGKLTYVAPATGTTDSFTFTVSDGAGGSTATTAFDITLVASPSVLLNELSVNPPGTDAPNEYVELIGTPGTSLNNVFFVSIEGDVAANEGNVTYLLDLTGHVLGSNGLLVIGSPGAYEIPAGTTFVDGGSVFSSGGGALQNGANTFALIYSGSEPITASDYDPADTGALSLPGGAVILDSVGWGAGATGDKVYGDVTLTQVSGVPNAASRIVGNTARAASAWFNGALSTLLEYNSTNASSNLPTDAVLTPGDVNFDDTAPTTLAVSSLVGLESGFSVNFSQAFNADLLNMYDSSTGTLGASDITLVGASVGAVRGSVVVNPSNQQLTFIRTGGPLEPDTYTVTLRSAANGFVNGSGELLDGDADGTAGGDYVSTFVVAARPANEVVVSIPDFARGFGQTVNLPTNADTGIPVTLSTGQDVTSVDLDLVFDPALLNVTGFSTTIPGASAAFNLVSPGLARITISSATEFSSTPGQIILGRFAATVPETAPYGAKHVLDLIVTELSDNVPVPRAARGDSAIHIAAVMGDSNGSRTYSGADSTLLQRLNVGQGTGFTAFQLADPFLVGDINRSNTLTGGDTTLLQRLIVNTPISQAPPIRTDVTPPAPGGVDPRLFIPQDFIANPGDTITIPVMLEVTEVSGISVSSIDLAISYDPSIFTVSTAPSNFTVPTILIGAGFNPVVNADIPGEIRVTFSQAFGPNLLFGQMGEIFQFQAVVSASASSGIARWNLRQNIGGTFTAVTDNDVEELVLIPAPTNADDDPVDGIVTIGSSNEAPVAQPSSVTTDEDVELTFSAIDFLFSDAEGDSLESIMLSGLDLANGDSLLVDLGEGPVPVTDGILIPAVAIPSLKFTPAQDANGAARSAFNFTVNDAGTGTVSARMTINVTAVNDAPMFSQSSYPFTVNSRALPGSTAGIATATDPDMGDLLTYSIVDGNALGAFAIDAVTGRITVANASKLPKVVAPNTSVVAPALTVQVSDGTEVDTAVVTITLQAAPQAMAPIAAARVTTFNLRENNAVAATVASLAGNPAYTGQLFDNWAVSDTPGGLTSSNFYIKSVTATGAVIGVNSRLSFEDQNSYTIYVTVSDSLDAAMTVTTAVVINITDVNDAPQLSLTDGVAGPPTFTSGTPTALVSRYTINEYTTVTAADSPKNGDVLFTLNATDDDQLSSSLVYALTGTGVTNPSEGIFVDRSGALQFDASTGQVTVLDATKLDFEKFRTGIPLAFTVTDNGLPGSLPEATPKALISKATVTILLNDLNDAPTFRTPTLTVVKAENNRANAAVFRLSATDGDTFDGVTQPLSYSIVSVFNGEGVNVTEMFTITSATNADTEVVTYSVAVVPARLYDFESTANKVFTLTVRATEDGVGGLSTADSVFGDQVVTLNIADVNDAPQLTLTNGVAGPPTFTSGTPTALVSTYTINEYTTVTAGSTPKNGDVLFTLNATDDDQSSSSLLYALTGTGVTNPSEGIFVDRSGALQFDASTGQVTVLDATKLDYEKFKTGIRLAFTVTDNGLPGSLPEATPKALISKATVTILLNDLNDAPTFATPTLTVFKAENNVANAAVVSVKATGGDSVAQTLTYSLVSVLDGTGADVTSAFAINPTTGAITVIAAKQYDFESTANKTFTLTVRATEDGVGGLSTADSVFGDQVITLNITDVNEAPSAVFTPESGFGSASVGTTGSVTVNLPDVSVGTTIGSLSITDPDILAALNTYGSDSVVVTALDSSSTTAPALTYVANSDPATGGSLQVNNLATLQSRVGKPFTIRFTIRDRFGLSGALSFTLTLTINVTNV